MNRIQKILDEARGDLDENTFALISPYLERAIVKTLRAFDDEAAKTGSYYRTMDNFATDFENLKYD